MLIRTNSEHPDFRYLVSLLDQDLTIRDGEDHAFYDQFNKIDSIKHAVVAYLDEIPVGCGAIKQYEDGVAELKRMYVKEDYRRKGVASAVLKELEEWAKELNYSSLILETGKAQPEAIALYERKAFSVIPNYGQYAGVENSVCMKKAI
ncbi:putative N-acetyltransferase YsnE [compost metagenome]